MSFCSQQGLSAKATKGYIDGLEFFATRLDGAPVIPGGLVISRCWRVLPNLASVPTRVSWVLTPLWFGVWWPSCVQWACVLLASVMESAILCSVFCLFPRFGISYFHRSYENDELGTGGSMSRWCFEYCYTKPCIIRVVRSRRSSPPIGDGPDLSSGGFAPFLGSKAVQCREPPSVCERSRDSDHS